MHRNHHFIVSVIGTPCLCGAMLLTGCGNGGGGDTDPGAVGTPIAWYELDDDLKTDSSGEGHEAVCAETCPEKASDGRFGGAAAFDGVSHLLVPDEDGALSTPDGYTAAAWVRLDSLEGRVGVFTKVYGSGDKNSWALAIDSDGGPFCFSSTEDENHALRHNQALEVGRWHHLACTWDGTTKRLYLDGAEVAATDVGTAFDTGDVVIGADLDGVTVLGLQGLVDEAALFDYALAPADVAALADTTLDEMPDPEDEDEDEDEEPEP